MTYGSQDRHHLASAARAEVMSRAGRSAISPPLRGGEGRDGPPALPLEKRDKDDLSRSERSEAKEKRESKDKESKEKDRLLPTSSSVSDIDSDVSSARQQQFERAHHRALASDAGQIVKLNVGGTRYFTTKGTLLGNHIGLTIPNFFHGLFGARVPAVTDSEGFIFIDRSGPYFEPVLNFLRRGEWHVDRALDERIALKEAAFFGLEPKGSLNDDLIFEMLEKRAHRRTRELIDQNKEKIGRICDIITTNFKRAVDNGEPLLSSPVFMPDDPRKLMADHITQYWRGHRFHNQAVQYIEKLTRQLTETFLQPKYVFDTQLHTLLLRASDDIRLYLQQEYRLTTEVKEIVYYLQSVDDEGENFFASVKTYRDPSCSVQVPLFTAIQFIWAGNGAISERH